MTNASYQASRPTLSFVLQYTQTLLVSSRLFLGSWIIHLYLLKSPEASHVWYNHSFHPIKSLCSRLDLAPMCYLGSFRQSCCFWASSMDAVASTRQLLQLVLKQLQWLQWLESKPEIFFMTVNWTNLWSKIPSRASVCCPGIVVKPMIPLRRLNIETLKRNPPPLPGVVSSSL
jgi:hypothetical protein